MEGVEELWIVSVGGSGVGEPDFPIELELSSKTVLCSLPPTFVEILPSLSWNEGTVDRGERNVVFVVKI